MHFIICEEQMKAILYGEGRYEHVGNTLPLFTTDSGIDYYRIVVKDVSNQKLYFFTESYNHNSKEYDHFFGETGDGSLFLEKFEGFKDG